MKKIVFLAVFTGYGLLLGGCSTTPAPVPETAVVAVQPGSERWSGDALYLPEGSPIVLSARPHALIQGLLELANWASDPELYADKTGPDISPLFVLDRLFGDDITRTAAWARYGLDTKRTVYFGLSGSSVDSLRFVDEIEAALSTKIGAGTTPLLDALSAEKLAPGLHSEVLRRTAGIQPTVSARIVVPALDPGALVGFIEHQALIFGWVRVSPEAAEPLKMGILGRAYTHPDLEMPAFSMRVVNDVVLVDGVILGPRSSSAVGESELAQLAALKTWLLESKAGRPSAPRIVQDADLAIGLDTLEASRLVRLRGYQRALSMVSRVDAKKRDDMLLFGLRETLMGARAWELRADELPGVAYSLTVGDEDSADALEFEMTMFTSPTAERVVVPPSSVGLRINDQGLGASFSLAPFNDEAWKKLVSIADPAETLDILDAGDSDPVLFNLALPRLILVILGNLVSAGPNSLNPISEIVSAVPSLERVEFAWVGEAIGVQRKLVLLATFLPGVSSGDRTAASAHLATFAASLAGMERSPEPLWIGSEPSPIGLVNAPGYAVMTDEYLLLGIGMEAAELEAERALLVASDNYAVHFRAEPSTWIPLLSQFPIQSLMKFDGATLAQRLGPVEVTMAPEIEGKTQSLRWRIQWKRPPRL